MKCELTSTESSNPRIIKQDRHEDDHHPPEREPCPQGRQGVLRDLPVSLHAPAVLVLQDGGMKLPHGQEWRPHERLWFQAPQWQKDCWWRVWGWHGGDEYGNCSVYLITGLLGGITLFYELDFQREVLVPEPGENAWADARYWQDYPDELKVKS